MIYTAILDFYRADPLVAWFLTGSACAIVLRLVVFAFRHWRDHEEAKAAQLAVDHRHRYDAAIGVSGPRPAGTHSQPWRDRRVS